MAQPHSPPLEHVAPVQPHITLNMPHITGAELGYIAEALARGELAGDGLFTQKCQDWLREQTGSACALLTQSCTDALEMAALLLDLEPGDEVIMPSFTFVSTANPFVLRGAVPVFVDVRPDTLNLDETLIEAAITLRTRAIVPVHYAGIACDMDAIMAIAARHGLAVVEDAAHAVGATWRGRPLGAIGDLGAYSFHETKNLISGEGGSLLINRADLIDRAEIARDKGTDRSSFLRGEVGKYTWQSLGSSFLPSEITAAFLWAQLERADAINKARLDRWHDYHVRLAGAESIGKLRRPVVPEGCGPNGHIYYILANTPQDRVAFIDRMARAGIGSTFHYVPLHSSPAGIRYGRAGSAMAVTDNIAARLVRLPLSATLTREAQARVIDTIYAD